MQSGEQGRATYFLLPTPYSHVMAYKIVETCIACGLCVPECPIDAISAGDPIYFIEDTCCDFEDCLAVCPVDAIVPVEADSPLGELEGTVGTHKGFGEI